MCLIWSASAAPDDAIPEQNQMSCFLRSKSDTTLFELLRNSQAPMIKPLLYRQVARDTPIFKNL